MGVGGEAGRAIGNPPAERRRQLLGPGGGGGWGWGGSAGGDSAVRRGSAGAAFSGTGQAAMCATSSCTPSAPHRSMNLVYKESGVFEGIPTYRFVAPSTLFANGSTYPPNEGFCPCLESGIQNISTCRFSTCLSSPREGGREGVAGNDQASLCPYAPPPPSV